MTTAGTTTAHGTIPGKARASLRENALPFLGGARRRRLVGEGPDFDDLANGGGGQGGGRGLGKVSSQGNSTLMILPTAWKGVSWESLRFAVSAHLRWESSAHDIPVKPICRRKLFYPVQKWRRKGPY